MSPRRKFRPGEATLLIPRTIPPRRWGLPLASTAGAVVMVAAITVCALMLVSHTDREAGDRKNAQVIGYVKWFMTQFTSVDPFHANEYVNRVLGQATGDFYKQYQEQSNQILVQVARAEPATGTVLDAGLERWNDDGSANVLVATEVTSKSPDEKQVVGNASRWTATVRQEGNQWKISNLLQVI